MDVQGWVYILFFVGAFSRPIIQYGLALAEKPGLKFNWRFLIGQLSGVAIGFLALLIAGSMPDVQSIVDDLQLPGALFYVSAFAFGYFWASIGRQGDKALQIKRKGSAKVAPK